MNHLLIFSFLFIAINLASAQQFIDTKIITLTNDTSAYALVVPKKKDKKASNYNQIQVIDSVGTTIHFTPRDIAGYIKKGITYKSLNTKEISIFMETVIEGTLYVYSGYEMEGGSKYIFKKVNEKEYNIMNTNFAITQVSAFNPGMMDPNRNSHIPIVESENVFVEFFTNYFKDCPTLARKIKHAFYTSSDIKRYF